MLGNVKPILQKFSDEEKRRYSAYYCGLCRSMGDRYGQLSRLGLNYDMAFIAIICDDLNGEKYETRYRGCIANPFKKKHILNHTKGTQLCADISVMLAYFKVLDDIQDEKLVKKVMWYISLPYFYIKFKRAQRHRPELAKIISREYSAQLKSENKNATIDSVAMPTANMARAIFRECAPENSDKKQEIGQLGFFLGRVIYLLDALKDMNEDAQQGKFNIFNQLGYDKDTAGEECFMALGEMAYWYRQIEFRQNRGIIENIIFEGLGTNINTNTKV